MASGPQQSRQVGHACRLYRNSEDIVIAIDSIIAISDTQKLADGTFHSSIYPTHSRILLHLGTGNRIVSKIQMLGDYTSIDLDGGNYQTVTWLTPNGTSTGPISLSHLPILGDTL